MLSLLPWFVVIPCILDPFSSNCTAMVDHMGRDALSFENITVPNYVVLLLAYYSDLHHNHKYGWSGDSW